MNGTTEAPLVLIAEEDPLLARLLEQLLTDEGYTVPAVVDQTVGLAEALANHRPDLLLLSIALESETAGLEFVEANSVPDETAVVLLTPLVDEATMRRVRALELAGLVVEPFTSGQVLAPIRFALGQSGEPQPPEPYDRILSDLTVAKNALSRITQELERVSAWLPPARQPNRRMRELNELTVLSTREREVLEALVQGRRPQWIAKELFISLHTVRNHVRAIYNKLGVHSHAELLAKVLDSKT